jgi:Endo-alpha-N-acetylgalactosaminidase
VLAKIKLSADKRVLNPLLRPGDEAVLQVRGFDTDDREIRLDGIAPQYTITHQDTSGQRPILKLIGNRAVAEEGGIAHIVATIVIDGITYADQLEIVVRPFFREYHQTLTLKLFLGQRGLILEGRDATILVNFEEALAIIKKVDVLTLGIPKIIYLVGWQEGGHDWNYPDWSQVNSALKLPAHQSALQSLRWLINEARRYNTTVSLHINMFDAYQSSPLWHEYLQKDVIARDADGTLFDRNETFHGEKVYCISYTREWREGLAQRRIDQLLDLIPELVDGHTIHIDAFHSNWQGQPISPWHTKPENGGITEQFEVETQRLIFKRWQARGLDVTGEAITFFRSDPFIGLQPMAWWYDAGQKFRLKIPESLYTMGRSTRQGEGDPRFGESMHGEDLFLHDKEQLSGFLGTFCRTTLVWYTLNRLERIELSQERLYYSDGVVAGNFDGTEMIRRGEFILRWNDDVFVPILWHEGRNKKIMAYSRHGYVGRRWRLPDDWRDVGSVDVYSINLEGYPLLGKHISVTDNQMELSLDPDQAVFIVSGLASDLE